MSSTATTEKKRSETAAAPRPDNGLRLQTFPALPDTLSGCGEYLTHDTSDFARGNYLFLSNLSSFALIRVNGKTVQLTKDTAGKKATSNKSYEAIYKGNGFKALLKMRQTKAYDEGGFYSGTLEISSEEKKVVYRVHGEVGC